MAKKVHLAKSAALKLKGDELEKHASVVAVISELLLCTSCFHNLPACKTMKCVCLQHIYSFAAVHKARVLAFRKTPDHFCGQVNTCRTWACCVAQSHHVAILYVRGDEYLWVDT